jgi:hypothetical protein
MDNVPIEFIANAYLAHKKQISLGPFIVAQVRNSSRSPFSRTLQLTFAIFGSFSMLSSCESC